MPCQKRRFVERLHCRSKSAPLALLEWSNKRKLWTNEQMLAAQPVNKAARDHGIPKTTSKDYLSGRVTHGTNLGPTPYLNTVEEDELRNFKAVLRLDTRRDAMGIAESIAVNKQVPMVAKVS